MPRLPAAMPATEIYLIELSPCFFLLLPERVAMPLPTTRRASTPCPCHALFPEERAEKKNKVKKARLPSIIEAFLQAGKKTGVLPAFSRHRRSSYIHVRFGRLFFFQAPERETYRDRDREAEQKDSFRALVRRGREACLPAACHAHACLLP